jgi:hypothetical protein
MKNNFIKVLLSAVVSVILLAVFVTPIVFAATCTPANGTACVGECCKLTKEGCIAGPCDKIVL